MTCGLSFATAPGLLPPRGGRLVVALALILGPGCEKKKSREELPAARGAEASAPLEASDPASEAKGVEVGVLYWSMQIPGQVAMREGLESSLAEINRQRRSQGLEPIRLTTRVAGDGDEGIERQVQQMRELVEQGVALIIVQPTDTAALGKVLQDANAAGIPVVAYDQHILNGRLTSFITSDNYQAGYLNGEYVASKFEDERELRIVLVDYPQVSSTVSRVDGFTDALESSGQAFKVLKSYSAVEPVAGKLAGQKLLADFPEPGSVDVVFTVNDGGGLAVFEELRRAGRNEIFGATVDGDPNSVERIRQGDIIKIDSAQFCGELGAAALRSADRVLRGQEVPTQQLVPVFPITAETFDKYQGWVGPVPAAFDKPWPSDEPEWSPSIRRPQSEGKGKRESEDKGE